MKKIGLYLGAEPASGGTFQYNQTLIEAVSALPEDGYSVVVAYHSRQWEKFFESCAVERALIPKPFFGRAIGVVFDKLHVSPLTWRRLSPYFHPTAKTLLAQQCDIWLFPSQETWSYRMPVPALASIHDLMHRYLPQFPEVSSQGESGRRDLHYRNICRWAKGILVDSEIGKQHVIESYLVEQEKVHVLPFVAPKYILETEMPAGFEARYPLPKKFIFYPAQFWEHKNHEGLIRAVAKLKESLPDLTLVLSGTRKNGYAAVLRLVKELHLQDDVRFLGYIPDEDVAEIYRRARAMVMPTFFGPTNIPPLEAFATGCPAAVSRIFAMPEQAGGAALLFDPGSVDEMADCVRRLWTDDALCAELSAKGKERARQWGRAQFHVRLRSILDDVLQQADPVAARPVETENGGRR